MNSNPSERRLDLTRRQAQERHRLMQQHASERVAAGLPSRHHLDFDSLKSNDEVWRLGHPNGVFSIVFMNGNLHIMHNENRDAGGMSYAEEISDDDLDRLKFVVSDFRAWRAGQVSICITPERRK